MGDEWLEFFYPSLKAWYHYVPVPANASKKVIRELVEFVTANDEVAKRIAQNGFDFVWNHLRMTDVNCYWKKLLQEYAKLLKFKPSLDPELVEIRPK